MGSGQYEGKVNKLAVRIAHNKHEELKGSGVLYLQQSGEAPLLFTAAHVLEPLFQNKKDTFLCLACSDKDGKAHEIEIHVCLKEKEQATGEEGETYIHPEYERTDKGYVYDVAIVVLSWKEWMKNVECFGLKYGKTGEKLQGWGFPESSDRETQKRHSSILAGKKGIYGKVDNIEDETKKFSFAYDPGSLERNITRENYMTCFSGTGLFCIEDNAVLLKGIISCEFGDRSAGNMLWASSSEQIMYMMEYFGLKQGCPRSFEPYMNMVADRFPSIRKEAKAFFVNWSEDLMEDHHLLPENFIDDTEIELPCGGNRKFCDDFWIGQLKKAVILYGVQGVPANELAHPYLKMPTPFQNDIVQIVFLCTEENAESVIGELIEKEYFAENKKIKNGTVFILNSRKNDNLNVQFRRYECRQVLSNITQGYFSERELKHKFHNLYINDVGEEKVDFDIIKGKIEECNLAAIGIAEMMFVLNQGRIDKERMKKEMERILVNIWEV